MKHFSGSLAFEATGTKTATLLKTPCQHMKYLKQVMIDRSQKAPQNLFNKTTS